MSLVDDFAAALERHRPRLNYRHDLVGCTCLFPAHTLDDLRLHIARDALMPIVSRYEAADAAMERMNAELRALTATPEHLAALPRLVAAGMEPGDLLDAAQRHARGGEGS